LRHKAHITVLACSFYFHHTIKKHDAIFFWLVLPAVAAFLAFRSRFVCAFCPYQNDAYVMRRALPICPCLKRIFVQFGHDLLCKIVNIIAEDGSRNDLITLCLVCVEWKRVASDYYWRRLVCHPARLDRGPTRTELTLQKGFYLSWP
jgi:hypothetical protein